MKTKVHLVSMHTWIFPNFREHQPPPPQPPLPTEITETSSAHLNEMNFNRLHMQLSICVLFLLLLFFFFFFFFFLLLTVADSGVWTHCKCIWFTYLIFEISSACSIYNVLIILIIEPHHDKQNDMCAQRGLGSGWASAQSDQSLRCPH